MAFKKEDWRRFKFNAHRRVTLNIDLNENGRRVDHFIVNDNTGFNKIIPHLKKYGFEIHKDKETLDREVKEETKKIEQELIEQRKSKWLKKDMEW